jgi:hypothetical protein
MGDSVLISFLARLMSSSRSRSISRFPDVSACAQRHLEHTHTRTLDQHSPPPRPEAPLLPRSTVPSAQAVRVA